VNSENSDSHYINGFVLSLIHDQSETKTIRHQEEETTSSKQSGIIGNPLYWALGVAAITGIVFAPMLANGFTNWDDQFYITSNPMFADKIYWNEVFTHPLMANFHPLTMMTLAMNYQVSGLSPFTYHMVNWLLHMTNTGAGVLSRLSAFQE
jgi:hypothetical protein